MKSFLLLFLICCFNSYSQHHNSDLLIAVLKNNDVINDSKLLKCDTIEVVYKSLNDTYKDQYLINDKVFEIKKYSNEFENGIETLQMNIDYKDKTYFCKKIFIIVTSLSKKKTKVEVFNPYTGAYITIYFKLKKKNYIQSKYVLGAI